MIVVADTSPVLYLVLIGAADVLKPLYSRVLLPQTVADELQGAGASNAVRAWIAQPPAWCEVRPDLPPDPSLLALDPGARARRLPLRCRSMPVASYLTTGQAALRPHAVASW